MRIAIMQPYIFPYIGYFQLIYAVDKFVVYDDVNFIKQGWIARNCILLNEERYLFSIPVENQTSFRKINETKVAKKLFDKWIGKFNKTLELSYKKAPYYKETSALVLEVLEFGREAESIASLCLKGIQQIVSYLEINTTIVESSAIYENEHLNATERVLDICKKELAAVYINAIGGRELYSREIFAKSGLGLFFLESKEFSYQQFKNQFVPRLSIIDQLMFNSRDQIKSYIGNYNLI